MFNISVLCSWLNCMIVVPILLCRSFISCPICSTMVNIYYLKNFSHVIFAPFFVCFFNILTWDHDIVYIGTFWFAMYRRFICRCYYIWMLSSLKHINCSHNYISFVWQSFVHFVHGRANQRLSHKVWNLTKPMLIKEIIANDDLCLTCQHDERSVIPFHFR
jgi:hypothetical protein